MLEETRQELTSTIELTKGADKYIGIVTGKSKKNFEMVAKFYDKKTI